MISQLKPNYIYNLNLYLKTLEQRNKYLRQIKEQRKGSDVYVWGKDRESKAKRFKFSRKL